jgi:hypothetical protein
VEKVLGDLKMRDHLAFMIPNHKADERLGANSRAHWAVKHRLLKADKETAWHLAINCLNAFGLVPETFLYDETLGQTASDGLPVLIHFKRFYSGAAKLWDDDNLASAYKGFRDGISVALRLNDRHFNNKIEQVRVDKGNWLEVYVYPAWAIPPILKGDAA